MPTLSTPIEVFCLYASADERYQEMLTAHLSILTNLGLISAWHLHPVPRKRTETYYEGTIDIRPNTFSVILLLMSADFLAEEFCSSVEMQRILQLNEESKARVIAVLLRPADWRSSPFGELQALPANGKPISTWRNRDEAFVSVATGLRRVLENLFPDRNVSDELGSDFKARQQAISKVAKADPSNIQEVAASQLSIINSYYQSGLQQSQRSFHWSLVWGGRHRVKLSDCRRKLSAFPPTNGSGICQWYRRSHCRSVCCDVPLPV